MEKSILGEVPITFTTLPSSDERTMLTKKKKKYRYSLYICGICGFENKRSIKFPPHKVKSCSRCGELFQDMP